MRRQAGLGPLALALAAVAGCTLIPERDFSRQPRPRLEAAVISDEPRLNGIATATYFTESDEVWISAAFGDGREWGVTIRDGTCEAPGDVLATIGPLEHDMVDARVDLSLDQLRGTLVVVASLPTSVVVACGAFPPR